MPDFIVPCVEPFVFVLVKDKKDESPSFHFPLGQKLWWRRRDLADDLLEAAVASTPGTLKSDILLLARAGSKRPCQLQLRRSLHQRREIKASAFYHFCFASAKTKKFPHGTIKSLTSNSWL